MNLPQMSLTKNIPRPNIYVQMLPEYEGWIFLEDQAGSLKGKWRDCFGSPNLPLDLEIGCGNGFFFEHQVRSTPSRNLLGIEIKYKPLVQTVRRVKKDRLPNGRGLRFHARHIRNIFETNELSNVFVFFPDPWPRRKQRKNRLVRREFLNHLSEIQKPQGLLTFKTDSEDYFNFVEEELSQTPYAIKKHSRDLHASRWATENFITSFERIFSQKGQPIFFMQLVNNK